jgi:hypothetical protein
LLSSSRVWQISGLQYFNILFSNHLACFDVLKKWIFKNLANSRISESGRPVAKQKGNTLKNNVLPDIHQNK